MQNLKYFILALVLLHVTPSYAGEVVPILSAKKRKCASLLNVGPSRTGQVLEFAPLKPEFLSPTKFIEQMHGSNSDEAVYFYAMGAAPFSKYDSGVWTTAPVMSNQSDLYILKTRPSRFNGKTREYSTTWRIEDLRREYRPVSYTRIQISPLFTMLQLAIQNIRGLESHTHNMQYETPLLDVETLLSEKSVKFRLINYLNSWSPLNPHEDHFKEFLKAYFHNNIGNAHEDIEIRDFLQSFRNELLGFYSEEDVGSLIFTLESVVSRPL